MNSTIPGSDDSLSGPDLFLIGKITKPHGLNGEVTLYFSSPHPVSLDGVSTLYFGRRKSPKTLRSWRIHQNRSLLLLDGVRYRDQAEALRGADVYVDRNELGDLEDDEFYIRDLIGAEVVLEDNSQFGHLKDVIYTGANDVYVIARAEKDDVLLPAIHQVIKAIDLDSNKITVALMPGLLPEE